MTDEKRCDVLTDEELDHLAAAAERGVERGRTSFGEVACDYLHRAVAELRALRVIIGPGGDWVD